LGVSGDGRRTFDVGEQAVITGGGADGIALQIEQHGARLCDLKEREAGLLPLVEN
jgi:hypothetical protein